jgi:plasmid stabilization system protein ParE
MPVFRVEPTENALSDAEEAFLWIHDESPEATFKWYEGLLERFRSLQKNPFRCSIAPESVFFDEEIRHLIYGKYRILFIAVEKNVFILRVRHGAREHLKPESDID